ncbi:BPI fold-containing family B member 2 isoform X2 [Macrotis lagotis]|uniref:BPI fold-containing family B member 2 isoform X2 n=1 Tax=Macrotis lagotis TaxID=92651 RepID=UPI003D692606
MLRVYTLLILLGMFVPFCDSRKPKAMVRINQKALDSVGDEGRKALKAALKTELPDFVDPQESESQYTPNAILDSDVSDFSLKFIPDYGIRLSAAGYVMLKIANHQKIKVSVNITGDISVTQASIGSPFLGVSLCKTTTGEITVAYGEDRLKELWKPLQKYIEITLPEKICLRLSSMIERLNIFMGTLLGLHPLGPETQISYSLTQLPTFTKDYMSLIVNTTLYLLGKPIVLPPHEYSLTLAQEVGSKNAMVSFVISEDLLDSIFFLMQKSGSVNLDITGQLNSKDNQLTTSVLGKLIPEVLRQFPKSMPIVVKARINASPISMIHKNGTSILFSYLLEVLVVSSNSAFKSLFSLDMNVELNLNIILSGVKLQANASLLKDINLKVTSSNVGAFDLSKVKPLITSVVKKPLLDHLNALFDLGAILPTIAQVGYIKPQVSTYEGYFVLSCELHFQK